MLFKKKFLALLEEGRIHIAFRKWTRPSVSQSGTLLTPVGQLRIIALKKIAYSQISDEQISQAGYENRKELDTELAFKNSGDIYLIRFERAGADPRIALRKNTTILDDEMTQILEKLKRLDERGTIKNWTQRILEIVDIEPGKYAIEYATKLGYEKEWFKLNIRKLKNLGLTVSLKNGYEISPRGRSILKEIKKRAANGVC